MRKHGPRAVAAALEPEVARWLLGNWPFAARDDQLPPDFFAPKGAGQGARWRTWLFMAGRGAGKTRAGAEWVRMEVMRAAKERRPLRIALVAPTLHDARSVMLEGASGLLTLNWPRGLRPAFEPSKRQLRWPTGALAQLFSADEPDSLRGPQFHMAWCDEIGRWRKGGQVWDMLMMGLRLGERPRVLATTTPAPTPLIRRLLGEPDVWRSHAKTADNAAHLGEGFIEAMQRRYGGTWLGRQELDGEFIDDVPDGLFGRSRIEACRVRPEDVPSLRRVVVAVDPPVSASAADSCCGIVVAGRAEDGHFYVLEDASVENAQPLAWARAALAAHARHAADRIVAEVNQGGDMVEALIRQLAPDAPYRAVRAARGKAVRAEPVAALYEQGRVHHAGTFPQLEDQLVDFERIIEAGASPDRADALIWALTALMHQPAEPRIRTL